MSEVLKINFPYFIEKKEEPKEDKMVIFFGTDFYNLPVDSNRENYIVATNKMLDYIRKHFSGFKLIYQAHPNEKEEFNHLNLEGFKIGDKKVAEVFLYENANKIEYCFSTCSWANGSAYAMGINSAVFLDLLKGSISDEAILAYHSYFHGLPENFFITSYDTPPPVQNHKGVLGEKSGMEKIIKSVGDSKTVWILATDPALALRGAILGKYIKEKDNTKKIGLLLISGNRWANIKEGQHLFKIFEEVVELPNKRIWYSARPQKILAAIKASRDIKKIPLKEDDALVSFSHLLFEENCILSYFPKLNKILFIESRWYFFIYEEQFKQLPKEGFNGSWGALFFNYILEPILRLNRTIFKELRDGKVLNIFRYRKDLNEVYDTTFVMMPDIIGE